MENYRQKNHRDNVQSWFIQKLNIILQLKFTTTETGQLWESEKASVYAHKQYIDLLADTVYITWVSIS